MKRALAVALLATGACSPGEPWLDFGPVTVEPDGQTRELVVAWGDGARSLRLEVESPTNGCFQLDALTDDDGHPYIGRAESGSTCVECEQRVSVGVGHADFQLPSRGGAFAPRGALHLRLGLRDCDTLTRVTPSGTAVLKVRARTHPSVAGAGQVALRLIVTPASALADPASDARLAALLEALNAELSSARLTASFVDVVRLPAGSATDATFSRSDLSSLKSWVAPTASSGSILVVLAGCLRQTDPVVRTTTEVQGYTPHIPGGSGPADGIFIQGSLCGTPGPVAIDWAASALARVMAHELGHYLGLYHSVEADGSTDQLDDTDRANLMFFRPSEATSSGFSATQAELMRAHLAGR